MRVFARAATLLALTSGLGPAASAQILGLKQWKSGPGANGHWYAITQNATDYRVAKTLAETLHGYLVSVTNAGENTWVYDNFIGLGTCAPVWCVPATFYIGLERAYSGGPFGWMSGEAFGFSAWNVGEPNDAGDERVAHMFKNNGEILWNDIAYNSNPMRAVIEWTKLPSSLSPVPEPATIGLMALGLGAVAIARRRFRRR